MVTEIIDKVLEVVTRIGQVTVEFENVSYNPIAKTVDAEKISVIIGK